MELDIREAPLRELLIHVPKGFPIARLTAAGMNDYFLSEPPGATTADLRIVYGQPISGRQLVQLRLEHNGGLSGTEWVLPRMEVAKARIRPRLRGRGGGRRLSLDNGADARN